MLSAWTVLGVTAWFGLVTGLGESYYLAGRTYFVERLPNFREVSIDSLWMAPVADVLVFLVLGAILVWPLKQIERRRAIQMLTTFCMFVTALTWIAVTGRTTLTPALLLAAGIAVQAGRYVAAHSRALGRLVRRTARILVPATLMLTAALLIGPRLEEALHTSRLVEPPADALNVVLIVLDTERAANLSLYGHHRATTPELDRWARRGFVYESAISPAPWTLPAHATLFTGRYNVELGTDFLVPLDDRYATLAEVLRERGYRTAAFFANLSFGNTFFGLDRGFLHYRAHSRSLAMVFSSSWITSTGVRWWREARGARDVFLRRRAPETSRDFWSWVGRTERPFFAFLNYFDAHDPYRPPEPFAGRYAPEGSHFWVQGGGRQDEAAAYSPREVREMEANYDDAIRYLDHHIGQLLDRMSETGLLEHTLVVLTSDHGEAFGEHGRMLHGDNLYLEQIHVPLVIWAPGHSGGTVVSTPVSLRDVPATLLDAAGDGRQLPGEAFLTRSSSGAWNHDPPRRVAFSQRGVVSEFTAVGERYQYIRDRSGREELYDLLHDPTETVNLAADLDYAPILSGFARALDEEFGEALSAARNPFPAESRPRPVAVDRQHLVRGRDPPRLAAPRPRSGRRRCPPRLCV